MGQVLKGKFQMTTEIEITKEILMSRLQAIMSYHDFSGETGLEIIPIDRDILSVIIHDPDSKYSESFEHPVAVILNSNLINDSGNEDIAEALHVDITNSVNKWDMSLIEACLLFTVLSIDFGHIPQDRNTVITTETLKTWAGKHVDSYIPTVYDDAMASYHNKLLQEETGSSDIAPGFDDNNLE